MAHIKKGLLNCNPLIVLAENQLRKILLFDQPDGQTSTFGKVVR